MLLAGCGGHERASIAVTPRLSLNTDPVDIRVAGFRPHAALAVRLWSRDANGFVWRANAVYRTDSHGRAHVPRSLVGSMHASSAPVNAAYFWSKPQAFHVTVTQGGRHAAATFRRELAAPKPSVVSLAHDGIFGEYFAPAKPRKPALLVFGGSEGGLTTSFLAATLAARGFPTLALAYFGEPGLPQKLRAIPLEYFARALRWLDRQPGVDAQHVFVLGISRGSEAAQLLAVHFPRLVGGVVAVVPSDYVNECYPLCGGSGWSLNGRPIPFTGVGVPEGLPAYAHARIRDERIDVPVLLICGGRDLTWPSCPYARDALRHLAGDPSRHELIVEPAAGHAVGELVPYESQQNYFSNPADERGREDVWPKLIAFLGSNG